MHPPFRRSSKNNTQIRQRRSTLTKPNPDQPPQITARKEGMGRQKMCPISIGTKRLSANMLLCTPSKKLIRSCRLRDCHASLLFPRARLLLYCSLVLQLSRDFETTAIRQLQLISGSKFLTRSSSGLVVLQVSMNELHRAASAGRPERVAALLSTNSFDIDEGTPDGSTPLMIAAGNGNSRVVEILLDKGANASKADAGGCTAAHLSARRGHLAATKLLVEAGAHLEAASTSFHGSTPLHLAAGKCYSGVMRVLLEAGANPNSRTTFCEETPLQGATPLLVAAQNGHWDAIKVLLRAGANPLLGATDGSGRTILPLDGAALRGHLSVICELIQQVGIRGCGGATRGVQALGLANVAPHLDIMVALTDAGVVDNGNVLFSSSVNGPEASVKFLLQDREKREGSGGLAAYVNGVHNVRGATTALGAAIRFAKLPSPRTVRLLVNAGADAKTVITMTDPGGALEFNGTPLALTNLYLREKKIEGKEATEKQLHGLRGVRRLLMRAGAARAVSWLWQNEDAPPVRASVRSPSKQAKISAPLTAMLPILRGRAERSRVLLAAVTR